VYVEDVEDVEGVEGKTVEALPTAVERAQVDSGAFGDPGHGETAKGLGTGAFPHGPVDVGAYAGTAAPRSAWGRRVGHALHVNAKGFTFGRNGATFVDVTRTTSR
jgi:hypothetical protein